MLWEQQKDWHYYDTGLMATGYRDALLLKKWFRTIVLDHKETIFFCVADLQRYKLITKPVKVGLAMRERSRIPFIFIIGKN
jgi:hypothetical protein